MSVKIFSAISAELLEKEVNHFLESSDILWQITFSHSDKYYMVLREFIPKEVIDFILKSLPVDVKPVAFTVAPDGAIKKAAIKKVAKKVAKKTDTKTGS